MRKFAVALITCGLLLSGFAWANASTITIGGDFGAYSANYGPQSTEWHADLTLKQFDTSLGTLTQIQLFLSGFETSTATVTASAAAAATWRSVSVATDISLLDPSNLLGPVLLLITPVVSNSNGSVPAGGTYQLTGTGTASDNTILTSGTAFDMFKGSGTISLATSAMSYGSTTDLSNGTFTPSGTASEHLYVVYTYDDAPSVPEPATMLLFGTGVAGLAAISRRKKIR